MASGDLALPVADHQPGLRSSVAALAAGRAALRAGRLGEARRAHAAALEAASAEGADDLFVQAALGIGGLWVFEQRDHESRATLDGAWARALSLAPVGSVERARLEVRVAAEAVYEGGPASAVDDALLAVRATGDDGALAEALSLTHHCHLGPDDAHLRLALAEEMLVAAVRAGDPLLTAMALAWRAIDLHLLGDPRAGRAVEELRARADALGCEALRFVVEVLDATARARSGDLEAARSSMTAACGRGAALGDPDALVYLGAALATIHHWQGRQADVVELVRSISRSPSLGPNDHVYVAGDAVMSAAIGDVDAAEEAFARLSAVGLSAIPRSSSWLSVQLLVAEAGFRLGRVDLTVEAAGLLEPYADLPVMPSIGVACYGPARRAIGLASLLVGDATSAVRHLQATLDGCRRLGNRPVAAIVEQELGWAYGLRGAPGDAGASEAALAAASARAARCGVVLAPRPPWMPPAAPARPSSAAAEERRRATLREAAGLWELEVPGRTVVLGRLVGLHHLATLAASPEVPVHVRELTGAPTTVPQAVLDAPARAAYRARAEVIARELGGGPPPAVAEALGDELAAIAEALRSGSGLGGRARAFPDEGERARTAVRKALRRAIAAIRPHEPDLADHLDRCTSTGHTCRYAPDGDWVLCFAPSRPVPAGSGAV